MARSSYNRIKVALAERQKTGKWLSEQLGKSETTVSRWTSNMMQPSIEILYDIASILKMDVRDLLVSNEADLFNLKESSQNDNTEAI